MPAASARRSSCGELSRKKAKASTHVKYEKGKRIEVQTNVRDGKKPVKVEGPKLTKGQYEKIPGTRIETCGGTVYRVIVEDGTRLAPDRPGLAKKHLSRLARKAEEFAKNSGQDLPQKEGKKKTKKRGGSAAQAPVAAPQPQDASAPAAGTAEERRRAKRARKEGRQVLSTEHLEGVVVRRAKGCVWVRLRKPEEAPESVLRQLRLAAEVTRARAALEPTDDAEDAPDSGAVGAVAGADGGSDELLVRVAFVDVAEKDLKLEPGVPVRFRLFADRTGVAGGCDVTSSELPR